MFETIDQDVERTEGGPGSLTAWLLRFIIICIVLFAFAAGLYLAID